MEANPLLRNIQLTIDLPVILARVGHGLIPPRNGSTHRAGVLRLAHIRFRTDVDEQAVTNRVMAVRIRTRSSLPECLAVAFALSLQRNPTCFQDSRQIPAQCRLRHRLCFLESPACEEVTPDRVGGRRHVTVVSLVQQVGVRELKADYAIGAAGRLAPLQAASRIARDADGPGD
jgi:hypothetical protein